MLDWSSSKQHRVSNSSYGAEKLACAEADDRGFYITMCLRSIFPKKCFRHMILVDSKGLYDTISTLHEGREYRLRQTVQRIRDSFESQDIDVLRWVQGHANISDALTKFDVNSFALLNRIARSGRLRLPNHQHVQLDSSVWV